MILRSLLLAFLIVPLAAASEAPLTLAPHVDLKRQIYGDWFIVDHIPYSFETNYVALHEHFGPRMDGDIEDIFTGKRGGFSGAVKPLTNRDKVVPGTGNASWRVYVLWPLSVPFQILYVDPADRFVLWGYPDRSKAWIFARKPTLSAGDYAFAMRFFAQEGYDTSRFRHVLQFPDQVGKPGFDPLP